MKVEEQNVATFNIGRKETAVAQIQASAKAFEILSSGLYSDAEFAIVREIAANAWDSHKAAGKADVPFRVQIPTRLDPRFCIRDYGTSMTHEFMMTRVNTYFDSTKNDNNDEIGGFGLGIKSVFSYTTSFMIATFLAGVRRVYAYQIGEKGLPEISLMAEMPTTEPDGVEVSIPVKEEDYNKFKLAVQKTFAFYDVKPEVVGVDLTIPEFEKVASGDSWFICGRSDVFDRAVYVEMGGIAYPVEQNQHGLNCYSRAQTLFLKANIGDIDITPNREQVKNTDRTVKFIKNTINVAKQELADNIQKFVDDQKFDYYWDMVNYLKNFSGEMTRALGFDPKEIKFNGKKYDSDKIIIQAELPHVYVDPNDHSKGMKPAVQPAEAVMGLHSFGEWEMGYNGRIRKRERNWFDARSHTWDRLNKPLPIIVLDGRQGQHISRWMQDKGVRHVSIVVADPGKCKEVADAVSARLEGFREVHIADELEYDKSKFVVARSERKFYIYHSYYSSPVHRSQVDYDTLPDTLHYIETDGHQRGQLFGSDRAFKSEGEFIRTASEWLKGDIYYLTEALIKKISKVRTDIELIKVEDALTDMIESKVREAAPNYLSNNKDSILEPLNLYGSSWKTDNAVQHWSKTFGLTDYAEALEKLKSAKSDRTLERMCLAIKKKTIFDLFDEYSITVGSVSVPSIQMLVDKIPYIYTFVDYYSKEEVINHISTVMGWSRVTPAENADTEDCD